MSAQETPLGFNRFRLDDIIIVRDPETRRVSSVFEEYDPDTPTAYRKMLESYLAVRQAAYRMYGCVSERIRCRDCGARRIPKALIGGRCGACDDAFQARRPPLTQSTVYYNPDDKRPWPVRGRC